MQHHSVRNSRIAAAIRNSIQNSHPKYLSKCKCHQRIKLLETVQKMTSMFMLKEEIHLSNPLIYHNSVYFVVNVLNINMLSIHLIIW